LKISNVGSWMDKEEHIAKTESLFRDVNERIAEVSDRFDSRDAQLMCECADPDCTDRIEVPLQEYDELREDGTRFVIDPDHVEPTVEKIVARRRGYAIVQKIGRVAALARRLNPRAETA
jgi:hypothetical protein